MYIVESVAQGEIIVGSDLELCIMLDFGDEYLEETKQEIERDGVSVHIHRFYEDCFIRKA